LLLYHQRYIGQQAVGLQAEVKQVEGFPRKCKQVELDMVRGILYVKAQLFEIGGDNIGAAFLVVEVTKGLPFYFGKVGGVGAF
jgi:hypothetical protein